MSTLVSRSPQLTLREIRAADADAVAGIIHAAFAGIHDRHGFARDFPDRASAEGLVQAFTAHPLIHGVVAEIDGRVVGSNFLDERGPVRGVGPITVDPGTQARGVGRALMEAVIDRGEGALDVRLLQDAFNSASMALYTGIGFATREPVALLGGRPRDDVAGGIEVRPLGVDDLEAAAELHLRVHGFDRSRELRDALDSPLLEPMAGFRDGRLVAYAAGTTAFAASHGVGETQEDLYELIVGALAATSAPASLLLPTRQTELFRSLLAAGLRVVKPMTYMTLRDYREPAGAWFPTVLY
ncbi:MAG TPA: GNAT family N-acetyltransferase [Solirubrobacteraceae bacterium]|nr:GNAT family N-acetyltransferase [Solirubrobacteraceae bacterium]